jgi:hypothetical protein
MPGKIKPPLIKQIARGVQGEERHANYIKIKTGDQALQLFSSLPLPRLPIRMKRLT